MLLDLLLIGLGIALLWSGGEVLVRHVIPLASALRVSPLVIGLTVVAFGTSAPELAASISAALQNAPGLVFGNVIGSNIANVALILGITALVSPIETGTLRRRDLLVMIGATILMLGFSAMGRLIWAHGIVMLALLVAYLADLVRSGSLSGEIPESSSQGMTRAALGTILGLILLIVGADQVLVPNAISLASKLGVSERIIGLTVVAFGTSVPELATCLVAGLRRHTDIVLGNIVGSNLFNLLLILGTAVLIAPIEIDLRASGVDLLVMLATSASLLVIFRSNRALRRAGGILFLLVYLTYIGYVVSQGRATAL